VKHVFLIVLSDQGYNAAFGASSQAPYLAKTLTHEGELLEDFYGVSGGELANEIAMVSGQGPTPQTAENCPQYTSIAPGTLGASSQILGSGCVYPSSTPTLAEQLTAAGKTWRTYVEGLSVGVAGQQAPCTHPALGSSDTAQAPRTERPYVTWRDPFVYFESVTGSSSCASSIVGLGQLAPDLKSASQTPSLSYIIPDRCHDGSEEPCTPGQPAGLAATDEFLSAVIPQIESSPAYKAGGLIAITFDQAPQSGGDADSSGCCSTPAFPNLPPVAPGPTTSPNTTTTSTGTASTPVSAGTTTPPTTTTPATPATPAGGGRVGLLLISKYVTPGSLNVIAEYNDFSLLGSIEELFGLSRLGYAGTVGLPLFNESVYNARR
jgi:hypothetical protein